MKNKFIIAVVAVIVLLIVVYVVSGNIKKSSAPSPSSAPTANESVSPSPTVRPTSSATPSAVLNYQDAVKKYAGTRIQFDMYCQASPNQITIKKGSAIMIDNRSGDARTFAVGTVNFTLPGYGFRIMTPTSKTLPATQFIACGSAQNVGRVIIQQ